MLHDKNQAHLHIDGVRNTFGHFYLKLMIRSAHLHANLAGPQHIEQTLQTKNSNAI